MSGENKAACAASLQQAACCCYAFSQLPGFGLDSSRRRRCEWWVSEGELITIWRSHIGRPSI